MEGIAGGSYQGKSGYLTYVCDHCPLPYVTVRREITEEQARIRLVRK